MINPLVLLLEEKRGDRSSSLSWPLDLSKRKWGIKSLQKVKMGFITSMGSRLEALEEQRGERSMEEEEKRSKWSLVRSSKVTCYSCRLLLLFCHLKLTLYYLFIFLDSLKRHHLQTLIFLLPWWGRTNCFQTGAARGETPWARSSLAGEEQRKEIHGETWWRNR